MLIYLIVKHILFILKLLPDNLSYALVKKLGHLAYLFDKKHRKIAKLNIIRNLNNRNNYREIIKSVYTNFFSIPLDIELFKRRIRKYNWWKWISFDPEEFDKVVNDNNGCILTTLHLGNWEIGGALLSTLGYKLYVIYGTLKNRHLDNYLNNFRTHFGEKVLFKKGALANLLENRNNKKLIIGMLTDQNADKRGILLPFIKDKASTLKTPALLFKKWGLPIVCGICYRIKNFKFKSEFVKLYTKKEENLETILLKINKVFKKFIEQHPHQWLWIHRRWNYEY